MRRRDDGYRTLPAAEYLERCARERRAKDGERWAFFWWALAAMVTIAVAVWL